MGLSRTSSDVIEWLSWIARASTVPLIWLLDRSRDVMEHVSERSTSTISGPMALSASPVEPSLYVVMFGHAPISSDSKNLLPPRSPRWIPLRSSVRRDDLIARCRWSRIAPPSVPGPGLTLSSTTDRLIARMAPNIAHAKRAMWYLPRWPPSTTSPRSERSMSSMLLDPLSC